MFMKYILKNKDLPLISFEMQRDIFGEYNINITDIYNASLIPLGLTLNSEGLLKWLQNRTIPKNREFVNEILSSLGLKRNDLEGIIKVSKSLSLNDCYWIVEEGFNGKFKDYNLYENDFNKTVSLIAYTGHGRSNSVGTLPELTTGGTLKKAWRNINNGIYLFKGARKGYANGGLEPFSEFYASQIAETMGLYHVDYQLEMWEGELASTCKLFTSIPIGYVPIYCLVSRYNSLKEIASIYKKISDNAYEKFCSMMVFDSLIYNLDRHLGNFGILRDNTTGNILDISPIFDNGISLLDEAKEEDANDFDSALNYCRSLYPAIGTSFDDNAALFKGDKQQKELLKLINFKFKKHDLYNLPDKRLELLERLIRHRAKELLSIKRINLDIKMSKAPSSKEFKYDELPDNLKVVALEEIRLNLQLENIIGVSPLELVDNYIYKTSGGNDLELIENVLSHNAAEEKGSEVDISTLKKIDYALDLVDEYNHKEEFNDTRDNIYKKDSNLEK